MKNFYSLQRENEKQAYILRLGFYSQEHREDSVMYMKTVLDNGRSDKEFQNITDLTELYNRVLRILPDIYQNCIDSILFSFEGTFRFLLSSKSENVCSEQHTDIGTSNDFPLSQAEENLLLKLDLKKYYPCKLTNESVIAISENVFENDSQKLESLEDLPWYFIRHIMGLDSDTHKTCHIRTSQNVTDDDSDSDADSENDDLTATDSVKDVHPLDLRKAIMMCTDDFLKQELVDKMLKCQYAVPAIIPMGPNSSPHYLLQNWALRAGMRSFFPCGKEETEYLANVKAPLVTFMSLGKETHWKSKLLNKMLSPQQETFWHEELKGGGRKQTISQGMVEVAWSLPELYTENQFPFPVMFTNVRGRARYSDAVYTNLFDSSHLTCIFVEEFTSELKEFLKKRHKLERMIIIVLHNKNNREKIVKDSERFIRMFNLKQSQVIIKKEIAKDLDAVYEQLQKILEEALNEVQQKISYSEFILKASKTQNALLDDLTWLHIQEAAETILTDIATVPKRSNTKSSILSCQSDPESRKKIADLEKEIHRLKQLNESNSSQYRTKLLQEKLILQLTELQRPISDTFKFFIQCLKNLSDIDMKYFLQYLHLRLNVISVDLLQPLYTEYQHWRRQPESEERNKKLHSLDTFLANNSLGIEHFFREMGILFENILMLTHVAVLHSKHIPKVLDLLLDIRVKAWLNGTALEIMDGDAISVPEQWLKEVITRVPNSREMKLLTVSAIGAQSCGKSTLLNSTFGLNFPVSSGRCTRGAYMQLVRVERSFQKKLPYEYVGIIDTEGLMSRCRLGNTEFDNELATLIIGLSAVTLVVLKDEGNEMLDVISLAILVFLQKCLIRDPQACHFVYQKRGQLSGLGKQSTEIGNLIHHLNDATRRAAEKTELNDQFKTFSDVLQYDTDRGSTYISSLCDGSVMGVTNPRHFIETKKLKNVIITDALSLQRDGHSVSFSRFAKRIEELWDVILNESFIFGFKSSLAFETYDQLNDIFTEKIMAIKNEVRCEIQKENNRIEKASDPDQKRLIDRARTKFRLYIEEQLQQLIKYIKHFFKCKGCIICQGVKNRTVVANNEKDFVDDAQALRRKLINESQKSLDDLDWKLEAEKGRSALSKEMDENITAEVEKTIRNKGSEDLDDDAINKRFKNIWERITRRFINRHPVTDDEDIAGILGVTITESLKSERQLYTKERTKDEIDIDNFVIRETHLTKRMLMQRKREKKEDEITTQDEKRLQEATDAVIDETRKYYDPDLCPKGRKFRQSDAEELFKDVIDRIKSIKDHRFRVTDEFKQDLLHFIEKRAVKGYEEMHRKYQEESSPEALLNHKKKEYFDVFAVRMRMLSNKELAEEFCKFLKEVIVYNILENKNINSEMYGVLKKHPDKVFNNIKNIHNFIMKKLMTENNFDSFTRYINSYEEFVREQMMLEIKRFTQSDNLLIEFAKAKLKTILEALDAAVERTVQKEVTDEPCLDIFLHEISDLEIPFNTAPFKQRKGLGKEEFENFISEKLRNGLRVDILETLQSRDLETELVNRPFVDFIFKEIGGCKETCPFCKAPCDAHSGNEGEEGIKIHSATMHRPLGLAGFTGTYNGELKTTDCCTNMIKGKRVLTRRPIRILQTL